MKLGLSVEQRLQLMCQEAKLDYATVIRDWDALSWLYHREEMERARAKLLARGMAVPS